MTSSGFKPATFRLVPQCRNQPRYRLPQEEKHVRRNKKQQKGCRERRIMEKKWKKIWMNVRTGRWDEVPYTFSRHSGNIHSTRTGLCGDLAPKWMV
jgi:hypothetical protein